MLAGVYTRQVDRILKEKVKYIITGIRRKDKWIMKDVNGKELPQSVYEKNETMKMLGRNSCFQFSQTDAMQKIDDIIEARPLSCTLDAAMDIFLIGYIYGKRAERARRKK